METGLAGCFEFGLCTGDRAGLVRVDTVTGVEAFELLPAKGEIARKAELLEAEAGISQMQTPLPSGGLALYLFGRSNTPNKAFISLHGGPESFEWSNLRYGGIYRTLIRLGYAVVIFNYAGSRFLGRRGRCRPHHAWSRHFSRELSAILERLRLKFKIYDEAISVFGGSFGGTLALAAGTRHRFRSVIATSPMASLNNHLQRIQAETAYKTWFAERFSSQDHADFSLSRLEASKARHTYVRHGRKDHICCVEDTRQLEKLMKAKAIPCCFDYPAEIGHAPTRREEIISLQSFIIKGCLG